MILPKCLPKMKNVKHTGFSAFHLENEEKNVDSCRAASQPISLFLHHMFLTFLQKTEVYLIGSMHSNVQSGT